jgi:hypothetical protein
MKKLFIGKKYLSVWLALAAIAAVSATPEFAQAATGTGSLSPIHYEADGSLAPGWSSATPSGRPVAHAQLTVNSGYEAFARAPAANHQSEAQSWPGSPDFGIESER